MSSSYISSELRRLVARRADWLCEYCLLHEQDTFFGCEVDHIIAEKHGGATTPENLAYACLTCNRSKGSNIASLSGGTELTRLFHPRLDLWRDHFRLNEGTGCAIVTLTPIGEVTARILGLNSIERQLEREALRAVGRYPTAEALSRMI